MKIISVGNLSKSYGKKRVLKGISIDVNRGEIFGLLGPNGSGKTTTLEILMGLRSYDDGTINLYDSKTGAPKRKLEIGTVFQTPVYYDTLTVKELLKFYRKFYKSQSNSIDSYLEAVNLSDKLDVQFKDLSGGQKQQISIVLSLINDPDVLFFDEPSTALDPQVRHQIWDLIRSLKQQGKAIVFSTHYIEEAEALADRVSILKSGEIVVTDKPSDIISNHNNHYRVEVKTEREIEVTSLHGFGFNNVRYVNGVYHFSVPCLSSTLFQSIKELSDAFNIRDLKIGKSSLEDVFVELTGEGSYT